MTREGWAYISITDYGTFSAITDWGNYTYLWSIERGGDFRQFLVKMDPAQAQYKLSQGRGMVYDAKTTYAMCRDYLMDLGAKNVFDTDWVEDALVELEAVDSDMEYQFWLVDNCLELNGDQHYDLSRSKLMVHPQLSEGFMKNVWPQLIEGLKKELALEEFSRHLERTLDEPP